MFIGIAGPICSGKRTVADLLVSRHAFVRLHLRTATTATTPRATNPEKNGHPTNATPQQHDDDNRSCSGSQEQEQEHVFASMRHMAEYVMKRWQQDFVTVDISDGQGDLKDAFLLDRPFFLLVCVDAPLSVRWTRFQARYIPVSPRARPPQLHHTG